MRLRPGLRAGRGAPLCLLLTLGALAGCGQRGPLTLPDSARPIELDPGAADQPTDANPSEEAESEDDERTDR